MAVGDAYVFPGFLTPVLTQLFFPKPPTTFLTCFCRHGPDKSGRTEACMHERMHLNQSAVLKAMPRSMQAGSTKRKQKLYTFLLPSFKGRFWSKTAVCCGVFCLIYDILILTGSFLYGFIFYNQTVTKKWNYEINKIILYHLLTLSQMTKFQTSSN